MKTLSLPAMPALLSSNSHCHYSVHRSPVSLDKTYIMQIHKYITADATANTTITTTIAAMTTVHTGPLSQLPRFPLDA